ncbi:MAG: hypothetical protein KDA84_01495, partial [Planctomycetaceae bacterium]|nr:hypothetical protein [Planctomycetaceae bacterium]
MCHHYNWTRYWYQRGAEIHLQGGFLYDPESEYGASLTENLVTANRLGPARCVVLLGGPGLGNSTELRGAVTELARARLGDNGEILPIGPLSGNSNLGDRLFGTEAFQRWQNGSHDLALLLDGLDECGAPVPQTVRDLSQRLNGLSVGCLQRLTVFICCRDVDWMQTLEADLENAFRRALPTSEQLDRESQPDLVRVYELAPLRRADVVTAAMVEGKDPEAFLAALEEVGGTVLATRPSRLRTLLQRFPDELPRTRVELFRLACLEDAEEWDERRFGRQTQGKFTAAQRLAAACRLAAISFFGERNTIRSIPRVTAPLPTELTWDDAIGNAEPLGQGESGESVEISPDLIGETLRTPLFTSDGDNQVRFVYRVVHEFMAALYL